MDTVTLRQYSRRLKTYLIRNQEKNPVFFNFGGWRCYPYIFQDNISDEFIEQKYRFLSLENRYLKAEICPDLGGRVFSARYKPLDKDLFFVNPAVKPAPIGISGAWIMSGVEVNSPYYGHSPTGLTPVCHTTGQRADGARWVRTGFHDRLTGLRWFATFSLQPGAACLDASYLIHNPGAFRRPCYLWVNAAVRAGRASKLYMPAEFVRDQGYQIFRYPEDAGRRFDRFDAFPVDMDLYGLDVKEEAFGYYDPDEEFGLVHWSPRDDLRGKKFFTWGSEDWTRTWVGKLTDGGDFYYEIQAGRLESQNDFEFIAPGQVMVMREKWYPVAGLGGLDWAGERFALARAGRKIRMVSCENIPQVRIECRGNGKQTTQTADMVPGRPVEVTMEDDGENGITISLFQGKTKLLERLLPSATGTQERPLPVKSARKQVNPADAQAWLKAGAEYELMDKPGRALECYRQAGGPAAGAAAAALHMQRGEFNEAESMLRKALAADSRNHTARYYLGVLLLETGNIREAEDCLTAALRQKEFETAARLALARLYFSKRKYDRAVKMLNGVPSRFPNPQAEALRCVISRYTREPLRIKRPPEIPHLQYFEKYLLGQFEKDNLLERFGTDMQLYLDIAVEYMRLSAWKDAAKALELAQKLKPNPPESLLEFWYYSAYVYARLKMEREEKQAIQKAGLCSPDYAFPFRLETLKVIQWGNRTYPDEPRFFYLKGNLFAGWGRYDAAVTAWEKARELGLRYAVLERNIGWALGRLDKELPRAAEAYDRAVSLDPSIVLNYIERDVLLCRMAEFERALKCLEGAPRDVKNRGAAATRRACHYLRQSKYKKAADLIAGSRFALTEWRQDVLELYRETCFAWAADLRKKGRTGEAGDVVLKHLAELPERLRLKPRTPLSDSLAYYMLLLLGKTHDWQGREIGPEVKAAPVYFELFQDVKYYYTFGRCLELTGEARRASEIYGQMEAFARRCLVNYPGMHAWWDAMIGLACAGLGRKEEAARALEGCVENAAEPQPFLRFVLETL